MALEDNISKVEEESTVSSGKYTDFLIELNFRNVHVQLQRHKKTFVDLMLMDFKGKIVKNTDNSILHTFTVHEITAENQLPDARFPDFIAPLYENEALTEKDYMLSITVDKSSPVAGISGFDLFQITLSPMRARCSTKLYTYLWKYIFMKDSKIDPLEISDVPSIDDESDEMKMLKKSDLVHKGSNDVDRMKNRAATTKIFNFVKFDRLKVLVDFHMNRIGHTQLMRSMTDIRDCRIEIQPMHYHSKFWTWTQFMERILLDVIKQGVGHIFPDTVKSVTGSKLKHLAKKLPSTKKKKKKLLDEETSSSSSSTSSTITKQPLISKKLDSLRQMIKKQSDQEEDVETLNSRLLFGYQKREKKKLKQITKTYRQSGSAPLPSMYEYTEDINTVTEIDNTSTDVNDITADISDSQSDDESFMDE
eukprot:CAMPEP_0117432038 /NCGR_PEP_ID=MMETSP0758-20121206/11570_1 /TAXON_ID=63605 /ORGANISM="Percolomonas cosmopolitus, Strain AE-1 (ATCC 50343)" /LENGTH=419 /DNA_ID=CAMNT_0005221643 /DNA_START=3382 /DNA_END=4638 /DNA_ORIENTATION=-